MGRYNLWTGDLGLAVYLWRGMVEKDGVQVLESLIELGLLGRLLVCSIWQLPFESSPFYHSEFTPIPESSMIANIISGAVSTFAVLDFVFTSVAGWRFIASKSFRDSVHAKWKTKSRSERYGVATFGFLIFVIVNGALLFFVVLTIAWLYRDMVLVRLNG